MVRFVLLAACLAATVLADASHIVDLTTDNFEALTQIGSGSTTGDWLIRFYAPWCGHCTRMAPDWESLAKGQHEANVNGDPGNPVVNIANVNCDQHNSICQKYGVRGYPTIFFFKGQYIYDYQGPRTVDAFEKFIHGDYKKTDKKPVPKPPSVANAFQDELKALALDVEQLFTDHSLSSIVILVTGHFITGLVVSTVIFMSATKSRRASVHKDKKVN